MLDRIQHRHHIVGAGHHVDLAVRVDGGIARVARGGVGPAIDFRAPVPPRHNKVALDADRTRRRLAGELSLRHAISPVGEHLSIGAQPFEAREHPAAFRSHGRSPIPRLERRRGGLRNAGRNLASGFVANLMAGQTAGRNRLVHHARPIRRRIVLGGGSGIGRGLGGQVELLSGLGLLSRRVDQSVTTHEHLVLPSRQIGQHVAPLVVCHDHPGEPGWQRPRLGDDPDARFRPLGPGDDAADIVGVDWHRTSRRLLCLQPDPRRDQQTNQQAREPHAT